VRKQYKIVIVNAVKFTEQQHGACEPSSSGICPPVTKNEDKQISFYSPKPSFCLDSSYFCGRSTVMPTRRLVLGIQIAIVLWIGQVTIFCRAFLVPRSMRTAYHDVPTTTMMLMLRKKCN